jgi:hypothetical protein
MLQKDRFDWLAMSLVLLIAAFFALTARFNSQPAPSFVPAAALSATGCGLLVTAIRKIRTSTRAGLLEAALGGFFLALFQFAVALTYPDVFATITTERVAGNAFLLTWVLVALFTIVLSTAGAALGHLAFAPLRPLPERARKNAEELADEEETEEGSNMQPETTVSETTADSVDATVGEARPTVEMTHEETAESTEEEALPDTQPRRSLVNYAINSVLFGLLPIMAGYVFAAIYDFIMGAIHADQIALGLYPTLSLLGGLLPWRLSAPIALTGANGSFIVFTLLWRIPDSFLGNPNTFDVQTLEPLLLNAAALALLLITMYGREESKSKPEAVPWRIFFFLEALLGLILILPPNLWLLQGLEGVLQIQSFATTLPTVYFLNPVMFTLNLLTAPLFCLLVGIFVRRQYQLWNLPRREKTARSEA